VVVVSEQQRQAADLERKLKKQSEQIAAQTAEIQAELREVQPLIDAATKVCVLAFFLLFLSFLFF
jgi:hypothetical protein